MRKLIWTIAARWYDKYENIMHWRITYADV